MSTNITSNNDIHDSTNRRRINNEIEESKEVDHNDFVAIDVKHDDNHNNKNNEQQQIIATTTITTKTIQLEEPSDVADVNVNDTTTSQNKRNKRKIIPVDAPWKDRIWEVIMAFWPLGFIAFGGPSAHVALLRDHLVVQRNWVDDDQFQELFAIGQGLPGPTSTQLVVSTALLRAGPIGGIIAFLVWSFPGLVVLTVCGYLIESFIDPTTPPWYLIGLPPAAISLVFVAFYQFVIKLDKLGYILAILSCSITILISNDERISSRSSQWVFPTMLAFGGLITFIDSRRTTPYSKYESPSKGWNSTDEDTLKRIGIPLWVGIIFFIIWIAGLITSIVLVRISNSNSITDTNNEYLIIFETMYRIGSIIYGGGQVVLPMLQDEVVPTWMTSDQFLQGLGLATSMPGPLFNFSAYLGAVYKGFGGAMVAFVALMLPGNLLIFAVVPFWARVRHNYTFRSILSGFNSIAVGLVGAACVILWESGISTSSDAIIFTISLSIHVCFDIAAPFVVLIGGIIGAIMHPDAINLGQRPYCIDQGYKYQ